MQVIIKAEENTPGDVSSINLNNDGLDNNNFVDLDIEISNGDGMGRISLTVSAQELYEAAKVFEGIRKGQNV